MSTPYQPTRGLAGYKPSAAELATLAALAAEKLKPTDADRPPLSTFPGKWIKPTPGQLSLDGLEVE